MLFMLAYLHIRPSEVQYIYISSSYILLSHHSTDINSKLFIQGNENGNKIITVTFLGILLD